MNTVNEHMTSHQDTTWISSQILYLVWGSFQVVWSSVGLKRCTHSLMDDSLLNYIQLSDQTDAHKCKLDAWQISKGISKNTCQGLCWNIATQQWRAHGQVMSRKAQQGAGSICSACQMQPEEQECEGRHAPAQAPTWRSNLDDNLTVKSRWSSERQPHVILYVYIVAYCFTI